MLLELSLQNFIFISTFIDTFGNMNYFGKAATVAQYKSEFQKKNYQLHIMFVPYKTYQCMAEIRGR